MEKKNKGTILAIIGLVVFLVSFILILPIPELYVFSLVLMFVGVILLGVGGAMMKGFDNSLDPEKEACYYCNGTGKALEAGEEIICPRCGGSGISPDESG